MAREEGGGGWPACLPVPRCRGGSGPWFCYARRLWFRWEVPHPERRCGEHFVRGYGSSNSNGCSRPSVYYAPRSALSALRISIRFILAQPHRRVL